MKDPHHSSLQGTNRNGLAVAIVLALCIILIVALGDAAFILVSIATGVTIGSGLLFGAVLCELLNRRGR